MVLKITRDELPVEQGVYGGCLLCPLYPLLISIEEGCGSVLGGRGVLLGILSWGVPPGSPNSDPCIPKKCHFPHLFSDQSSKIHTRFQNWPLGRNYVIITRLECKHKNPSNPFRIRIFLFLSYSFRIETINTFIHSVLPSKNIPDSRPNWGLYKIVPPGGSVIMCTLRSVENSFNIEGQMANIIFLATELNFDVSN